MPIGGDDISNDVITLATYFSMFAYIRACLSCALIGGNLTAQSMGSHGELEEEFKFQRQSCKLSFLFPPCRQSAPESLLTGYVRHGYVVVQLWFNFIFLCFGILVMYDNAFETKENKIYTKDKIEPQHAQLSNVLTMCVKS